MTGQSTMVNRGFTLIEFLIGLAIMGLLLMVAMPSYSTWIQNTAVRTSAESIANAAQLARAEAVRQNTNVELTVNPDTSWTVSVVGGATVQSSLAEGGTNKAKIAGGGTHQVTFNGFGRRLNKNNDGSDAMSAVKVAPHRDGLADIRELCIVVATGGATRMCDPGVSSTDPRSCPSPLPAGCS